ncbi:toprim domain-containing protein [Mariprofundus ferrooxydans]|uniref:toprim domain-containing protein n=1 Tax=Mariprofundus ferrooxydans TaxID=314344 RepID=UPI0014306025|nr:toprim domain-containing protein [Mariprofundus ferrooxydans]
MNELNDFKTLINFAEYAESTHGYVVDRSKGKRRYITMKTSADTIVINRDGDGHWRYFNRHDAADRGTIIDFIQRRTSMSLGRVRKHLRPFLGSEHILPPAPDSFTNYFDRESVKLALKHDVLIVQAHPYLTSRGIPEAIQARYPRSIGMGKDCWHNAVFPHRDDGGWCGAELKNRNFTGFIKDSKRGIWLARPAAQADAIAVAETAIDALSYAALHPGLQLILVSLSGTVSPDQIAMLALLPHLPLHICTDADAAGDRCAGVLVSAFSRAERHRPTTGKDWNETLTGGPR